MLYVFLIYLLKILLILYDLLFFSDLIYFIILLFVIGWLIKLLNFLLDNNFNLFLDNICL